MKVSKKLVATNVQSRKNASENFGFNLALFPGIPEISIIVDFASYASNLELGVDKLPAKIASAIKNYPNKPAPSKIVFDYPCVYYSAVDKAPVYFKASTIVNTEIGDTFVEDANIEFIEFVLTKGTSFGSPAWVLKSGSVKLHGSHVPTNPLLTIEIQEEMQKRNIDMNAKLKALPNIVTDETPKLTITQLLGLTAPTTEQIAEINKAGFVWNYTTNVWEKETVNA